MENNTPIKKNGFIFRISNNFGADYEVEYQSLNKGELGYEYPVVLGYLTKTYNSTTLYISVIGNDYHARNKPNGKLIVETKEAGAELLLYLKKAMLANPLPDDVKQYLEDECESLRKELTEANRKFFSIQCKRRFLQTLADKYGLKFEFDGDINKESKDLLDFIDKDLDLIYKKLGKDWARSLRAYVGSLVRCVDPLAAVDI